MLKLLTLWMTLFSVANADCEFNVLWEQWQPYQFKKQQHQISGLDNDILRQVISEMNCGLNFTQRPWQRGLVELQQGKIHIASGASKTPERQQFALFSIPYRQETVALVSLKSIAAQSLAEITQLSLRVGVSRGYYYGEKLNRLIAKDHPSKLHFEEAGNDQQNLDKLLSGRVDAILIDPLVANDLLTRRQLQSEPELNHIAIEQSPIYFMFSKKIVGPEFVHNFNSALSSFKKSKSYKAIKKKYLIL